MIKLFFYWWCVFRHLKSWRYQSFRTWAAKLLLVWCLKNRQTQFASYSVCQNCRNKFHCVFVFCENIIVLLNYALQVIWRLMKWMLLKIILNGFTCQIIKTACGFKRMWNKRRHKNKLYDIDNGRSRLSLRLFLLSAT